MFNIMVYFSDDHAYISPHRIHNVKEIICHGLTDGEEKKGLNVTVKKWDGEVIPLNKVCDITVTGKMKRFGVRYSDEEGFED